MSEGGNTALLRERTAQSAHGHWKQVTSVTVSPKRSQDHAQRAYIAAIGFELCGFAKAADASEKKANAEFKNNWSQRRPMGLFAVSWLRSVMVNTKSKSKLYDRD